MYSIRLLDAAARDLSKLDRPVGRRIINRLEWLADNLELVRLEPLSRELRGLYKFRVGDYRVLYEILHDEELILVHAIGHRRDIYRL